MKSAVKYNPEPIDQMRLFQGKVVKCEVADEELTDLPTPEPTFRSNLLRLRKTVSEKLFSIDLGKISF